MFSSPHIASRNLVLTPLGFTIVAVARHYNGILQILVTMILCWFVFCLVVFFCVERVRYDIAFNEPTGNKKVSGVYLFHRLKPWKLLFIQNTRSATYCYMQSDFI